MNERRCDALNRNTGRDGTPGAAGRRLFDLRPWLALLTTAGLLLALASWLLLSTPAAAAPPAQETPPLPADARAGLPIYLEKCAPCHGETGMGNGPQAAQLQFPPAQFADTAAMWGKTPADLFAVTKNGRIERFMPPFAQSTSDQDLWNVLAYVWSLHLDPAELQQGEAVYQAACAGCHGAAGQGDGPDAGADLLDLTSLDATANRSQRDWFDSLQSSAHSRVADLSDAERWASLEFVRTWTLPPLQARPFAPGDGAISGVVTNDTPQGDVTAGLTVTLSVFDDFDLATQISSTTSVTGLYRFDSLNTDPGWLYVANLSFKDVPYSTGVMTFTAAAPVQDGSVTVYEPTNDSSVLAVERAHWFLEFDQSNLLMAELYIWSNNSDRVYVGAASEDDDAGRSVLPFALPPDFQNLSFDDGDLGRRYQLTPDGAADTLPLPPGQGVRQTLLRYVIPFTSLTLDLQHPVAVPLRSLNVLVADVGAQVSSPDLQEGPARQVEQATYFNFTAAEVPAGKTIELKLTNLPFNRSPETAAATQANSPWLAVGVAVFAALGLLGVLYYAVRQRQRIAEAEGDEDEDKKIPAAAGADVAALQRRRQGLILAIARLDDRHASGNIPETDYAAQRGRLKADLLAVAQMLRDLEAAAQAGAA